MRDRTYHPVQMGEVYVEATITFKGSISTTLYDMSVGEWISEILSDGEYEYEVVRGNVSISNTEEDYEELG